MDFIPPFIRLSNISEFTPMLSSDDIMQKMLNPQKNEFFEDITGPPVEIRPDDIKKMQEISSQVLTSVFHTMTKNAATTKEIIETIYDQCNKFIEQGNVAEDNIESFRDKIIKFIARYIKFVHEDYNIVVDKKKIKIKKLSETEFCIKKEGSVPADYSKTITVKKKQKIIKVEYFKHKHKFGLLSYTLQQNKKLSLSDTIADSGRDKIFTVRNTVESKLVATIGDQKAQGATDAEGNISLKNFLNEVDKAGDLKISKDNTSLSYILMNNPNIRTGTKNSLEIATFLNNLSTFELSKCYPFLDVKFLLPEFVTTKSDKIFKTASIVSFLKGTPISDDATGQTYKVLEASYIKQDKKTASQSLRQPAVETNMAAFTMPQTALNFDETYVGHLESYSDVDSNLVKPDSRIFERNNIVHDYTKPFLTIKSFNVDIAPTAGLMSFKTGRLSMTLHDKTRMADIAPFIKPDLFGSFGAEIAIQYGWSHMDAMSNMRKSVEDFSKVKNYFAEFLDTSKVYEKYIITNSSYSIDANGQVNIDLSIAMKGPIEIRSITFESDQPKQINSKQLERRASRLIKNINKYRGISDSGGKAKNQNNKLKFVKFTGGLESVISNISSEFKSNLDPTKKSKLTTINNTLKNVNLIKKDWQNSDDKDRLFYSVKGFNLLTNGAGITTLSTPDKVSLPLTKKAQESLKEEVPSKDFKDWASNVITNDEIEKINSLYNNIVGFIRSASFSVNTGRKDLDQTIKTLLTKFTGGLSGEDAFFDKQNFSDIEMLTDESAKKVYQGNDIFCTSIMGIDINSTGDKRLTDYVSLGNFILALLGSHTAYSGTFDEIQIISYTLNDNAGLAANINISSLLIQKKELENFIYELFQNGAQYTLESLFMQIVKKFVTTRFCVNYGLSDFYILDENNNVVPKDGDQASKFESNINKRIEEIHNYRQTKYSNDNNKFSKSIKFVMPKIKFLFDSMTRDDGEISVLRISIIDQHDNPFQSAQQIMQKINDKDVESAVYDINSRFIDLKSQTSIKDIDKNKAEYINKNREIINKLIEQKIISKSNDGSFVLQSGKNLSLGIKNNLKTMMPSITYGTNNSAILEASISTINEAKLNTVYITRPDRNAAPIKSKVKYAQDLPLRILPSQVNITMFGCPFINFAQYLFLDFETNTTIDNQYIVTGLKHDITPGKFTTSLTLSYGDAYGKYETIIDTLNRTLKEIETGEIQTSKTVLSRNGQEVINNVNTSYDLTNLRTVPIPPAFQNLSSDDLDALGWNDADVFANNIKIDKVIQSKFEPKNSLDIKFFKIEGLENVKLKSHKTSDKDMFSYNIQVIKNSGSMVIENTNMSVDVDNLFFNFNFLIHFNNSSFYYSSVNKSQNNFFIVDICKKLNNPNAVSNFFAKEIDDFIREPSKKLFADDNDDKKTTAEKLFNLFFDSHKNIFKEIAILLNTPYLVFNYKKDVKDIKYAKASFLYVVKYNDKDKELFVHLLSLLNKIDKKATYNFKRKVYLLNNIEIDNKIKSLTLTFNSKAKDKKKNPKYSEVLKIDLNKFLFY